MTSCSDFCGLTAAFVSSLAYGSYGVPIKATLDIEVHPLVLQSYKTIVMFFTCWFVLALGVEAKFTPLGLLSGILWVSGGTLGIYGIRSAGMAIAVGTWSSVMVLVNFIWGILIFKEPVYSIPGTIFAFFLLLVGVVGMSKYSSKEAKKQVTEDVKEMESVADSPSEKKLRLRKRVSSGELEELAPMLSEDEETVAESVNSETESGNVKKTPGVFFIGGIIKLNQHESGILCAVLNGFLAGSCLIPLHYAKAQGFGSLSYIISFGTGSFLANILVWIIYFFYQHNKSQCASSFPDTFETMPSFHFKKLWLRGLMAGILLAIGQFCSIQATSTLGQGVGNSLVQSKILISGLWGICFYKEIKEKGTIAKWFMAAALAVLSIMLLSYQRLMAKAN